MTNRALAPRLFTRSVHRPSQARQVLAPQSRRGLSTGFPTRNAGFYPQESLARLLKFVARRPPRWEPFLNGKVLRNRTGTQRPRRPRRFGERPSGWNRTGRVSPKAGGQARVSRSCATVGFPGGRCGRALPSGGCRGGCRGFLGTGQQPSRVLGSGGGGGRRKATASEPDAFGRMERGRRQAMSLAGMTAKTASEHLASFPAPALFPEHLAGKTGPKEKRGPVAIASQPRSRRQPMHYRVHAPVQT